MTATHANGNGIDEKDKWAFRRIAMLLSRIRYEDAGHGDIHVSVRDGKVAYVRGDSTFTEKGEGLTQG